MAIQEIVAQAKSIDVSDLVGRYVLLERASGNEWQGPCPKCGGSDRLHCSDEWWFCRQCHTKRDDAIAFLQFATGCTFQSATEQLTNQQWPERLKPANHNQTKAQRPDDRDEEWFEGAARLLRQHQLTLPGSPAAEYLRGRGLVPSTWAAFGLGFATAANRDTNRDMPAVAMPWYRGGKLTAIRYRFLAPVGKQKLTSLPGSKFGGVLFGGQAIPDWVHVPPVEGYRGAEQHCTLILCEGEINAMSIWQVAHDTNVHVMSLGSETSKLSAGAVTLAGRYGRVFIWMDKEDLAKQLMEQVNGAFGIGSPGGQDANDLLQAKKLGGFLVEQRWKMCRNDDERHGLFWDLWDAANEGDGLDDSTSTDFAELYPYMKRNFDLMESQPGVWVTAQRMMTS